MTWDAPTILEAFDYDPVSTQHNHRKFLDARGIMREVGSERDRCRATRDSLPQFVREAESASGAIMAHHSDDYVAYEAAQALESLFDGRRQRAHEDVAERIREMAAALYLPLRELPFRRKDDPNDYVLFIPEEAQEVA